MKSAKFAEFDVIESEYYKDYLLVFIVQFFSKICYIILNQKILFSDLFIVIFCKLFML